MIRADRLTKRFGPLVAVQDLSFEVVPGEVLGFLGPNGAGKSTTLRILSGWWPASSGAASIAGHDLARDSLRARRQLGYLPESFMAAPELRVVEYLRFRARLKGLDRRTARTRLGAVAERLGLQERLRQPFGALSKGFRQRVGLADALLADPPALLLDEPFGGLDPLQRQDFRKLLRVLAAEGKAVLFSSHVLPEVEDVADRLIVLLHGRSAASGTLAELSAHLAREAPLRVRLAGGAEALEAALQEGGAAACRCALLSRRGQELWLRPEAEDAARRLFRWLAGRDAAVLEFGRAPVGLEEMFRHVIESGERAAAETVP
ncbi:MAG TPA: ABC transporter ATP-binding protein [Planctomycetota bacterium]